MRAQDVANNKGALSAVLILVFFANWLSTKLDPTAGDDPLMVGRICRAIHQFEGAYAVHGHDHTSAISVYGYTVAYLAGYGILMFAILFAFLRRPDISPYRVFVLSIAADYAISLPFYMLIPVRERWTFVDSGAVLLTDLWSPKLIEFIRPYSGLDNCAPSFHTSSTTLAVLCAYLYGFRFRTTALIVGVVIILSTLVLGIHWVVDVITGLAAGVASVAIARRLDARWTTAAIGSAVAAGARRRPEVAVVPIGPPIGSIARAAEVAPPTPPPRPSPIEARPKTEPEWTPSPRPATGDAPEVFICYSRADQTLCDEFVMFMRSFERSNVLKLWRDKDAIAIGTDWEKEIDQALEEAEIGILMISQDFLDSPFILERELPTLVRAAERRSVTLACVFLTHSTVGDVEIRWTDASGARTAVKLTKYQGCHDAADPVAVHSDTRRERTRAERAAIFSEIARNIAEMARSLIESGLQKKRTRIAADRNCLGKTASE